MQCIDDSAIKFQQTNEDFDVVLKRISENRLEEINEVVKIIDSTSNNIEKLYSCSKFIEIFDNKGFLGFVN